MNDKDREQMYADFNNFIKEKKIQLTPLQEKFTRELFAYTSIVNFSPLGSGKSFIFNLIENFIGSRSLNKYNRPFDSPHIITEVVYSKDCKCPLTEEEKKEIKPTCQTCGIGNIPYHKMKEMTWLGLERSTDPVIKASRGLTATEASKNYLDETLLKKIEEKVKKNKENKENK